MRNILKGRWVFDSNLLIYGLDRSSTLYSATRELFVAARNEIIQIVIAQQNITEVIQAFVKGYRQPVNATIQPLQSLITELEITVISPLPTTYHRFLQFLSKIDKPTDIFDYYLAATMLDNGINKILTVNVKDFREIKEIEAVNPFE